MGSGGKIGPAESSRRIDELDRHRRSRNSRALSAGLCAVCGAAVLPLHLASVDGRVVAVTLVASALFGGCAWLARPTRVNIAGAALNVILAAVLLAGVAVNRQIGPGPAFVAFSLFVAAATLPLRALVGAGAVGALTVAAMFLVARTEPQVALQPGAALTYGLALAGVTTILSVVQSVNARRALTLLVEGEQRALEAEARARESESRYRLTTDTMSDLIALLDADGRFLYASPSFDRVLGIPPDVLLGGRTPDRMHPEDRARAAADFAEALARGRSRGTYRCRDTQGRERWVEAVYDAVPGDRGPLVAVGARDVTENRALAAQLQQAQKMDALGRMAAAVAHDFNNLLMVISSGIEVAMHDVPAAGSTRALIDARQAATGAMTLTARLMAFSRKGAATFEEIDSRRALDSLGTLLPRALGPGVALDLDLAPDLPVIRAAPAQIEQVLLNLAINGRDAMLGAGKLAVVARLRRLGEAEDAECEPGDWLEIVVTDTGTGMSDEVLAHLFEPFFTTKPAGQGTGLGLSTCYGIVRQLGGRIRVRSEVGKGTSFTVLLPGVMPRTAGT